MRQPLLLILAVCGLLAGAAWGWQRAVRVPVPPPPDLPADWADPPLVELGQSRRQAVLDRPRDPQAWGDLGLAFHAHARAAEAEACYRTAMLLDGADARWPYLLAAVLRATDPDAAVELVRRAAPAFADPTQGRAARLTLADLLAEVGQPAEAETLCRGVLAEVPTHPRAAFRLAALLTDRGDDAAATPLLLGMARNPHAQQRAAVLLAGANRRAGRVKEADGFAYAASLLPADRPWPDPLLDVLPTLLRGRQALVEAVASAERQNRPADAVAAARRLVADYNSPPDLLLLGKTLVAAGRNDDALPVLADALRGDPGLVMAHAFRGIAEFQLGERAGPAGGPHYQRAADALQKAVELKPDYAVGHLYRGRALAALGRPDDALQAVRAFLDRRPEEWEGYAALAELLRAAGRRDEAVAAAEKAVALSRPQEQQPRRLLEQLKAGK